MREDRIMTDVGTNEWQVVVFSLGDQSFAINVDKTREILRWTGVGQSPSRTLQCLNYNCQRRGNSLIDLRIYLNITPAVSQEQSKVIVTEFNLMKLGFVVDGVERIYRIHSEELDSTLTGSFLGENVLYVIKREDRNILLLIMKE